MSVPGLPRPTYPRSEVHGAPWWFHCPTGGRHPGPPGNRRKPDSPAIEEPCDGIHGLEGICAVYESGSGTSANREGLFPSTEGSLRVSWRGGNICEGYARPL